MLGYESKRNPWVLPHTLGSHLFPSVQPLSDNDLSNWHRRPFHGTQYHKGPPWPARDNARCFLCMPKHGQQDITPREERLFQKTEAETSHGLNDQTFGAKEGLNKHKKKKAKEWQIRIKTRDVTHLGIAASFTLKSYNYAPGTVSHILIKFIHKTLKHHSFGKWQCEHVSFWPPAIQ